MIHISDIKSFALSHSASEFEKYCVENKIVVDWLDVCLTNFDEDYYNVQLPKYGLDIQYYNGVLEGIIEW